MITSMSKARSVNTIGMSCTGLLSSTAKRASQHLEKIPNSLDLTNEPWEILVPASHDLMMHYHV